MKVIYGKNINLRTVEVEDAEFILELRLLEHKNRYLSRIENNVQKQKAWLQRYKEREQQKNEYYFVIENKQSENLGLVRVYDLKADSFCWGSWLIKDNSPRTTAIESALQIYEFGFCELAFSKSHFDVRIANKKVVDFHLRFGAEIIGHDNENLYFIYRVEKYSLIKEKYKRYLI